MKEKRETTIVYSPSTLERIRKVDPYLIALTRLWEEAFRSKVQVEIKNGRLIIKKKDD